MQVDVIVKINHGRSVGPVDERTYPKFQHWRGLILIAVQSGAEAWYAQDNQAGRTSDQGRRRDRDTAGNSDDCANTSDVCYRYIDSGTGLWSVLLQPDWNCENKPGWVPLLVHLVDIRVDGPGTSATNAAGSMAPV